MKIYSDTNTKDVKAYVLYVDTDDILYHDEDCKNAVSADEIFDMFATGIIIEDSGAFAAADGLTPADTSTAYATLTVGTDSYYTVEKDA